jgi:ornithine carbamoyltransferase
LLTLHETYSPPLDLTQGEYHTGKIHSDVGRFVRRNTDPLASLRGKKIAWVGDMNNIAWELMATCPRLGMTMSVATPQGYDTVDDAVLEQL